MKSAVRKINSRINIFTVENDAEVREPLARDILQIRKWKVAVTTLTKTVALGKYVPETICGK